MGNNQSQQAAPVQTEVVRRPPTRPNAPPSSRPVSDLGPKGPSYHSPQNMVLPKDIPMMRLRPVSMELMKFHPEYKEMFNHSDDNDDEDKENMVEMTDEDDAAKLAKLGTSPPRPPPPILKNGNIPNGIMKTSVPVAPTPTMNHTPNGHVGNGIVNNGVNSNTAVVNTNSKANVPYRPSHRRQISLGQEQHIIMEEPEENIDSRFKLDPLMQSFPGETGPSLPVKNNFNLDYSYQLTYVQLAEHRRNKTIEDIEKKTGKKLSDLSADLNENQDQPFKRAAPSRISSKSTGSGGSALSSKKKRAPAPPGENGSTAQMGASNTLPLPSKNKVKLQHQSYSVENEPPADYEMDSPRREVNIVLPRYKATTNSAGPPVPPAPPIALNGNARSQRKSAPVSRNNSLSTGKPEIILKRTPSVTQAEPNSADGEVPWLLQIKNLSKTMSARRQQSLEASSDTQDLSKEDTMHTEDDIEKKTVNFVETSVAAPLNRMVYQSNNNDAKDIVVSEVERGAAMNGTNTKVDSISLDKADKPASPKLIRHASTLGFQQNSVPMLHRQISEPGALSSPNQTDPVRRLNSLLQYDIKATANAKCHKVKKQITPVPAKPKDPHEVFREQLAKACAQRDERVKVDGTIDEKFNSESANLGKVTDTPNDRKDSTASSEPQDALPKPPRYHKNVSLNRNSSYDRRQTSKSPAPDNRASLALDWTPEDDLDSDDNLSDRDTVTTRKGASDGFKSTIVPKNINDLKSQKKFKKEKKPKVLGEDENNKHKFGSVKKLKKSMQKSVKNAFGSISKASGRVLRKQRAEDLEHVEDAPKNWKLSHNDTRLNTSKTSDRAKLYMVPNGYGESDSDSEKVEIEDHEYSEIVPKQKVAADSTETSDEEGSNEHNVYKSKTSDLSAKKLSPREQTYMYDSEEEIAVAKYKQKKKKELYRASVKEELEQEQREAAAIRAVEELRERERKLEAERRKQLEMELEIHKIRETETRERLQRLENAHLQQQLNARLLQQQQQQNMSMQLSAPPLPAPAGNYNLGQQDPAQTQAAYNNLFGTQLPQNGYQNNYGYYPPTQTGPLLNGMTYDINDYMRMLGVQSPPNPQQVAYFLNGMNLSNQAFDRKTNPTLMEVINHQDPLKQFTTGHVNYQLAEPNMKKQAFESWASAPNMNISSSAGTSVPMSDFVASYSNSKGANNSQSETKTDKKVKARNPLYNSDDSDEGLSPQRTVVQANVSDFRKMPARTESGKFMRQFGSSNYVSKTVDNGRSTGHADVPLSNGLSKVDMDAQHVDRVSPSNSTSTLDSAIASPSVSLSTPSSPSRSVDAPASPMVVQRSDENGFRTILDLTSANSKTQITMVDGGSNYS